MRLQFMPGAATMRGFVEADNYDIVTIEEPSGGAPTLSEHTVFNDIEYDKVSVIAANNFMLATVHEPNKPPAVIRNLTPDVCSLDSAGHVTIVGAGGVAILAAKTPTYAEKRYSRTLGVTTAVWSYEPSSFAAGSLAAHIQAQTDALTAGKTPSAATQRLYSAINLFAGEGTVNTNMFAYGAGLKFNCMASQRPATWYYHPTLISPRHVIVAAHAGVSVGETLIFHRDDGSFQSVLVEAVTAHGGEATDFVVNGAKLDIQIAYLADAITGVTPVKTMPLNWELSYAPSASTFSTENKRDYPGLFVLRGISTLPSVRIGWRGSAGQYDNLGYVSINNISAHIPPESGYKFGLSTYYETQIFNKATAWGILPLPGDSGSPHFFVINGELALVTTTTYGSTHCSISGATTEINIAMNNLATAGDPSKGSYALQHPSLVGFNSYA